MKTMRLIVLVLAVMVAALLGQGHHTALADGEWGTLYIDVLPDASNTTSLEAIGNGTSDLYLCTVMGDCPNVADSMAVDYFYPDVLVHDPPGDVRVVVGGPCPCSPPVGGIADLPDVAGSSSPNYIALAALAAAAVVALTAGGWYARRRWLA